MMAFVRNKQAAGSYIYIGTLATIIDNMKVNHLIKCRFGIKSQEFYL